MRETCFKGTQLVLKTDISTIPGSASLHFEDEVSNLASDEKEFQTLYHVNFAKELLEKGSELLGTIESVKPFDAFALETIEDFNIYDSPGSVGPGEEKVYLIKPFADEQGRAHFMLQNAAADKAVSFTFNTDNLPYFTQWKNEDSLENGYVTGLEPGNSHPANRSHERKQGRVEKLKGGESKNYSIEYSLHSGKSEVNERARVINELNEGKKVEFIKTPEL